VQPTWLPIRRPHPKLPTPASSTLRTSGLNIAAAGWLQADPDISLKIPSAGNGAMVRPSQSGRPIRRAGGLIIAIKRHPPSFPSQSRWRRPPSAGRWPVAPPTLVPRARGNCRGKPPAARCGDTRAAMAAAPTIFSSRTVGPAPRPPAVNNETSTAPSSFGAARPVPGRRWPGCQSTPGTGSTIAAARLWCSAVAASGLSRPAAGAPLASNCPDWLATSVEIGWPRSRQTPRGRNPSLQRPSRGHR